MPWLRSHRASPLPTSAQDGGAAADAAATAADSKPAAAAASAAPAADDKGKGKAIATEEPDVRSRGLAGASLGPTPWLWSIVAQLSKATHVLSPVPASPLLRAIAPAPLSPAGGGRG